MVTVMVRRGFVILSAVQPIPTSTPRNAMLDYIQVVHHFQNKLGDQVLLPITACFSLLYFLLNHSLISALLN